MGNNSTLFLFILIFACISAFLWTKLGNEKQDTRNAGVLLRAVLFFFCCDFFILSVIKWYLGNGEDNTDVKFEQYRVRRLLMQQALDNKKGYVSSLTVFKDPIS